MEARDRIIAAATKAFYAQGIRATGVDQLIALADVAKATFYRHFPSKDDLVAAVLERQSDAILERLATTAAEAAGKTGLPAAVSFVETVAAQLADPRFRGCPLIRASQELAESPQAQAIALAHKRSVEAGLAQALAATGVARASERAAALMLVLDGAVVRATMAPDPALAVAARYAAQRILGADHAS